MLVGGISAKKSSTVRSGAVVLSRKDTLTKTSRGTDEPRFVTQRVALKGTPTCARSSKGRAQSASKMGSQSLLYGSTTTSRARSLAGSERTFETLKKPSVRETASSKLAFVESHENSVPQYTLRYVELLTATASDAFAKALPYTSVVVPLRTVKPRGEGVRFVAKSPSLP